MISRGNRARPRTSPACAQQRFAQPLSPFARNRAVLSCRSRPSRPGRLVIQAL